ncbi:sugar-transfer associated ATP-grasp domain-containing protein [Rhodanobacter umsongensis]|uniref:Sugar-transfer associated ATP-grasp domain-containing protein n=1 Tax=Rhodanobacter umsongensis TaxID=633153 RepID=A0ABW0JL25_9GAMM
MPRQPGVTAIPPRSAAMSLSAESLKNVTTAAGSRVYSELRQVSSNYRARSVLRSIESQQGPTDRKLFRLANEYSQEVLGSAKYAPWMHVYTAISGGFKEGWIPDNYYGLVVEPLKSGGAAKVVNLKSFTNRILHTEALPDLAYVIDGIYYDRDFKPISETNLIELLFAQDGRVFFKSDNSCQGRDVVIMTREDFPRAGHDRLVDGVFQAPIKQHEFFAAISAGSTATVRITTARELDGTVAVKAAYLRVGRAADEIVRCRSHVRVAADIRTGALNDTAYLHNWRRTEEHPDTQFRFAGHAIPHFSAAAELCRSLHASCPHMPCVGWDVCIDQDNQTKIMEWNARYNDIKFSEATAGPCFRGLGWESLWKRAAA